MLSTPCIVTFFLHLGTPSFGKSNFLGKRHDYFGIFFRNKKLEKRNLSIFLVAGKMPLRSNAFLLQKKMLSSNKAKLYFQFFVNSFAFSFKGSPKTITTCFQKFMRFLEPKNDPRKINEKRYSFILYVIIYDEPYFILNRHSNLIICNGLSV